MREIHRNLSYGLRITLQTEKKGVGVKFGPDDDRRTMTFGRPRVRPPARQHFGQQVSLAPHRVV